MSVARDGYGDVPGDLLREWVANHAKQARGWRARPRPGPRHTFETTTPTGHRYRSTAPAARGRPAHPTAELHLVYGGPELALDLQAS